MSKYSTQTYQSSYPPLPLSALSAHQPAKVTEIKYLLQEIYVAKRTSTDEDVTKRIENFKQRWLKLTTIKEQNLLLQTIVSKII